jgi:hypothetical protein
MATIVETVTQVRSAYDAGVAKLAASTAAANAYVASAFADLRFKFLPAGPLPTVLLVRSRCEPRREAGGRDRGDGGGGGGGSVCTCLPALANG